MFDLTISYLVVVVVVVLVLVVVVVVVVAFVSVLQLLLLSELFDICQAVKLIPAASSVIENKDDFLSF